MNKKLLVKKIIVSVLTLLSCFFVYEIIGYLILGIKTPKIYGTENSIFMGMYILCLTYFILLLLSVSLIMLELLSIKKYKNKQNNLIAFKNFQNIQKEKEITRKINN